MIGLLYFFMSVLASPFKSKLRLEAENAVIRHQLIVLKRRLHGRVQLTNHDRWFFIQLYTYDWIRLFMFAGLKGLDFNARYLGFLRKIAFELIVREIRHESGLAKRIDASDTEAELVWGLHASIFYIGVRKFIYGMPGPQDIDADVAIRVKAFLHGVPKVMASL